MVDKDDRTVPWLITQRPAVVHKDVLSQADILICMKLTSSQDRDAIGGLDRRPGGPRRREAHPRRIAELPRLQRGECFLWAPSDGVLTRVAFPKIRTFDSSRTPRRGERVAAPRTLADVDLSAIVAALAATSAEKQPAHRLAAPSSGRPSRSARSPPAAAGRLGRTWSSSRRRKRALLGLSLASFSALWPQPAPEPGSFSMHRRCARWRARRAARQGEFRLLILSGPFAARKPLRGGACVSAS
jgi:hypothetical protein